MNSRRLATLTATLLLTLASGCSSLRGNELPPVQVVETCPAAPDLPAELTEPLPNFLSEINTSLTDYFSLELKLTKRLGSVTSR